MKTTQSNKITSMFTSKLTVKKIQHQDNIKSEDNRNCPGDPDVCKERCVETSPMGIDEICQTPVSTEQSVDTIISLNQDLPDKPDLAAISAKNENISLFTNLDTGIPGNPATKSETK